MSVESNPYVSPLTTELGEPRSAIPTDDAESIRRQYLNHEASVRAVGLLYYMFGNGMVLGSIITGTVSLTDIGLEPGEAILGIVCFPLGVFVIATGWALHRLQPWTKAPVGIVSGIGLLGVPLCTIVNSYILYLVFSAKGTMVFSPEYREIIRQTPHVTYRSSVFTLVLLALLAVIVFLPAVLVIGILCAAFLS